MSYKWPKRIRNYVIDDIVYLEFVVDGDILMHRVYNGVLMAKWLVIHGRKAPADADWWSEVSAESADGLPGRFSPKRKDLRVIKSKAELLALCL